MIRLNKVLNLLNLQGDANDFDTIFWIALLSWRTLENVNGQIFTPLSRGRFNDKLKILMHLVESELIGRFSSKSFRIGATSVSYALNIPTDDQLEIWVDGQWTR